ncbi:general stress protein [Schaalia vaccimaxillae]|uniref:general stress protein n=1 Tax=Schaalia vaccimaxillae TaxID=183916 RepID=UPI0003B74C88|nr:general stress protein [Schaalia vaccimaxillae]
MAPNASALRAGMPTMPSGTEVASYKTYAEAQAGVDFLSDNEFDVKVITIVGTDLHLVERITGRLTMARSALSGATSGAMWGGFMGLMMSFASQNQTALMWVFFGILGGALIGTVMAALSYAMSGGQRDFTSQSQVVASRYAVLASGDVDQAFTLLQRTPGNQMRPRPARVRPQSDGPTEYGSRPDEQPRFGVRTGGTTSPAAQAVTADDTPQTDAEVASSQTVEAPNTSEPSDASSDQTGS